MKLSDRGDFRYCDEHLGYSQRIWTFAAGFRDYLETSEPIDDLPPIDRLIRGDT
jgi:hypothetical protein